LKKGIEGRPRTPRDRPARALQMKKGEAAKNTRKGGRSAIVDRETRGAKTTKAELV